MPNHTFSGEILSYSLRTSKTLSRIMSRVNGGLSLYARDGCAKRVWKQTNKILSVIVKYAGIQFK